VSAGCQLPCSTEIEIEIEIAGETDYWDEAWGLRLEMEWFVS